MKQKMCSAIFFLFVFSTLYVFLSISPAVYAQDSRIVRIYPSSGDNSGEIRIEPKSMWVLRNSTIIWVNMGTAEEVKINFLEGKKCELGTDAPVQYSLAECGYVTSWVPEGATASLRFVTMGTYKYEVEWKGTDVKETGTIVVQ